nr:pyruvate oxidase [Micromonospora sp. DSM 115978]
RQQPPVADFAAWARACGGYGTKVTEPSVLRPALLEAFAFDGPAIVDCDVDPNEPPMPGKVSYEQATSFAQSFLRGQPHKASMLAAVSRDKINKLRSG